MARTVDIKVEGLGAVNNLFADIRHTLSRNEVGQILRAGGRAIASESKRQVPFKAEIKRKLRKDIVVSRIKGSKEKPHVLIGPNFKETIGNQKVAVIAQHMTEGFNQKNRTTKSNKKRGVVKDQLQNAMLRGFELSEGARNESMNKEIQRKIKRIQTKHSTLLR